MTKFVNEDLTDVSAPLFDKFLRTYQECAVRRAKYSPLGEYYEITFRDSTTTLYFIDDLLCFSGTHCYDEVDSHPDNRDKALVPVIGTTDKLAMHHIPQVIPHVENDLLRNFLKWRLEKGV